MTNDTTGDCEDTVFAPLYLALDYFDIGRKSPIFVITDAIPNDVDDYQVDSIFF